MTRYVTRAHVLVRFSHITLYCSEVEEADVKRVGRERYVFEVLTRASPAHRILIPGICTRLSRASDRELLSYQPKVSKISSRAPNLHG